VVATVHAQIGLIAAAPAKMQAQRAEPVDTDDYEDEVEEGDDATGSGEASDDELNLKMFGIHQVLPVAGEPDWDQGAPRPHRPHLPVWRHARGMQTLHMHAQAMPSCTGSHACAPPW
jgi:hypothetical protein